MSLFRKTQSNKPNQLDIEINRLVSVINALTKVKTK